MISDALIEGDYRYWLTRSVTGGQRDLNGQDNFVALYLMLNPSTAGKLENDHTIRKLVGFSKRFGFTGFIVANLYAYRSTDKRKLMHVSDPVGPDNDRHIVEQMKQADQLIVAWGNNPFARDRIREVISLTRGRNLYCIGENKNGSPKHPLMAPYSSELEIWERKS